MNIPKVFWAYYDLFRRGLLTLQEFSEKASLPAEEICQYLREIEKEA